MTFVQKTCFTLMLVIAASSCESSSSTSNVESASGGGGGGGENECAFTQGYWKNHPEAWPVTSLKLGSVTYSQQQLLAILHKSVQGNGLVSLAHQLIAAKLNIANGADGSDISDEIIAADALIGSRKIPPIGDGYLSPSSTSSLVDALDDFNNTGECKPEPVCGNGKVEEGEECDDGNTVDNDACSNECEICPPPPVCGNGKVEGGEECDDGNTVDNDACSNECKRCIP